MAKTDLSAPAIPPALRKPHLAAWEKDYARRGATWRGTSNFEPNLPKGSRILELGVGNGKNLSALIHSPHAYHVDAIDISPAGISHAKHFLAGLSASHAPIAKRATLHVMDACDLDFADNTFDAVVCFHTIDHLHADERQEAAGEIARVLKPGGRVFVKVWRKDDMRRHKGNEVEPGSVVRQNGILYHYFGMDELKDLFEKPGGEPSGLTMDFEWCDSWNVSYEGKTYTRRQINAEFAKGKPEQSKSSKIKSASVTKRKTI